MSKLTQADKDRLDLPITLNELDFEIRNSNKASAPGIDGLSNRIIEFYWEYLKRPLLKSFNYMVGRKKLSHNFNTIVVKIIPKKGDLGAISNWRPISLLSCSYKIISAVLCNRLNTVIDKLLTIKQKGFSSSKLLQNNLSNIFESISHLNASEIDAALCCVDFKKAFDNIAHSYIKKC